MNGAPEFLPGRAVQGDDRFGSVSVPSGGAVTTVLSFKTRVGLRPFLVMAATNTDGAVADITWNVKADGAKLYPYADFNVSPCDPSFWTYLPWPIELSQNSEIAVTASNAGASAAVCTARLFVYYVEF